VAAVCDICAKKPSFGNNRPWSRKITKRRFDPNIQRVRAKVNGTPMRLNVCTPPPHQEEPSDHRRSTS
jgi:large subunit ribosomal protein L28